MTYIELGNELATTWLQHMAILNGRLLILLGISFWLLRQLQSSAARRHLFIAIVFVAAMLLPFSTQWMPAFEIVIEVERAITAAGSNTAAADTAQVITQSQAVNRWPLLLFGLYVFGSIWLIARNLLANFSVFRLVKQSHTKSLATWHTTLRECAANLGITTTITLCHNPTIRSPMTWGFLRPIIIIPSDALHWQDNLRRSALLHELAHIKRSDYLSKQFAQWICALYWVNPLCWWALRRFSHEAETASDDIALNCGIKHSHYAQNLLQVAKQASRHSSWSVALAMTTGSHHDKPSEFGNRVLAILNPHGCRAPINWACLSLSFLFVFGFLLPITSLRASVVQEIKYVVTNPKQVIPLQLAPLQTSSQQFDTTPRPFFEETLAAAEELTQDLSFNTERPASTAPLQPPVIEYVELPASVVLEKAKDKVKQTLAKIRDQEKESVADNTSLTKATNKPVATSTPVTATEYTQEPQTPLDLASLMQHHHAVSYLYEDAALSNEAKEAVEPYSPQKVVTPDYPRRALNRRIEGELTAEFNINSTGQVEDVRILNAQPSGVFDRAVIKALLQSRYSPQKVNGKAVPVSGVQERYVFVLES